MAAKDNKRKRDGAEGDRPSKKAAAGSISVSFPALQDELHPIIGTSHTPSPPSCFCSCSSSSFSSPTNSVTPASSPGLNIPSSSFKTFSKTTTTKKNPPPTPTPSTHSLLLHSSAHPKLDYTAAQEPSENKTHYIAVYDADTSSLQVLPAHPLTVRTTLRSETQEVAEADAARTFAQQREELGMAFGTKKARKALNARYENAITTGADKEKVAGKLDAVESAVMDSVVASAAMPNKEELADTILASKPIPRPNLKAQSVEEAYPLSVLVPAGEMRALAVKDWQDKVEAGEDVKCGSRFVAHRLNWVAKSEDVPKLKALRYMLLLIDFHNALQPGRGGKKVPIKDKLKVKMSEWPEALIDSVRRRFADSKYVLLAVCAKIIADVMSSELNKWHLDNLMTHMAAISLYIDSYRTDTFDLREDLRMENKQCVTFLISVLQ